MPLPVGRLGQRQTATGDGVEDHLAAMVGAAWQTVGRRQGQQHVLVGRDPRLGAELAVRSLPIEEPGHGGVEVL
jgi:hypothetical protein